MSELGSGLPFNYVQGFPEFTSFFNLNYLRKLRLLFVFTVNCATAALPRSSVFLNFERIFTI